METLYVLNNLIYFYKFIYRVTSLDLRQTYNDTLFHVLILAYGSCSS